jgi:hypothetical protein
MKRTLVGLILLAVPLGTASLGHSKPEKSSRERGAREGAGIPAKQFGPLFALIKPRAGEWRWDKIAWQPNVWEARKKAAAEGKPLFIFLIAGEPLGNC